MKLIASIVGVGLALRLTAAMAHDRTDRPLPEASPARESAPGLAQSATPRREHRTPPRATPPARAPEPAPVPPRSDDTPGLSPMQRVQACRGWGTPEAERNVCIINALRGRANSMQELGMLAATYQMANRTPDAVRTMRTYIQRFPQGPLVARFAYYIQTHP